jgi:hypothetical protein
MSENIETMEIKCPVCKNTHTYNISINKSHVIYNLTANSFSNKRNIKKFKRIFLCPQFNEMFESILCFEEYFGEIISDVKIIEE